MKSILTLIAAGGLLASLAVAQTPSYTLTDLGALGPNGQPIVITNNGLIAGSATLGNGVLHAVLWYKGLRGDIGAPGLGGQNSVAYGVNEMGQAVGAAQTSTADPNGEDFCGFKAQGLPSKGTTCLPFLWQYAVTIPLPTLGGSNGTAFQVNRQGTVAGFAENTTKDSTCPAPQKLQFRPVIWENGEIQELPIAPVDFEGVAKAVNDNGQVVGGSGICAAVNPITGFSLQPLHALLWETGTVTDLGSLGGTGHGFGNLAYNINSQGQVVGYSDLRGNANFHSFLWSHGKGMQDLGTLTGDVNSLAIGINEAGDVVGVSLDAMFNPRAFLWKNGAMTDLHTLIPAGSPLSLLTACSINSREEIVGFAVDSKGNIHGYIATPSDGLSSNATNAVVTPLSLTTNQASLVLDGGGSTSTSGNLRYLFTTVPGGREAFLLQTPSDPKATVEFASGPGLYLVQLTVTDASGNASKSPVVTLNYQPSGTN